MLATLLQVSESLNMAQAHVEIRKALKKKAAKCVHAYRGRGTGVGGGCNTVQPDGPISGSRHGPQAGAAPLQKNSVVGTATVVRDVEETL